ncbi:hypothetical protein PIB30_059986 [Stylosanthes scabra]|uniref:Leucine-rich repeat-containing N-terminal plant-type domain-containing protein n=1 Tax=Stylosanthes scabra TaxID=79078 RepID=A0ABU6QLD7_9FABA|nr:hypothetical protein [Stylosanthes scabra]
MDWPRKKPWLVLVVNTIVLVQVFGHVNGCFPEEKRSLLEFKAAYSKETLLPSWVDHPNSDCCKWERVTCDSSSGHVFNLSLQNLGKHDIYGDCLSPHLNWSLFLSFKELTILDLSHNCFQDFVFDEGICEMNQLEELYLKGNNLQGTFETCLGNMTSLRTLDLSHNSLRGSIPTSIRHMSSLRILNLGYNNFSGNVPDIFDGDMISESDNTHPISGLHIIDLSHNQLCGELNIQIPPSLVFFSLQGNRLTGVISIHGFDSTTNNLVALDLSDNAFNGTIPGSIYRIESLVFLLLAGNQLQDELSSQLCQLQSLQILDLSRNNITGSIPSCLNNIAFRDVNFIVSHGIETSVSYGQARRYIAPMFRLKFRMGQVQFMTKGSFFSYEGSSLKTMSALDLSSNQLTGEIPRELGDLSSLHTLNLSHNHLTGSIPESFHNLHSIESLDLSSNSLNGEIPPNLQDLYSLEIFNVSYNNLSGIAPEGNQFADFDDSNYEGNPFLRWTNSNRRIPPSPTTPLEKGKKDDCFIDLASFYWTFSASYVTVLLALVTILWINPYWRSMWFYFVVRFLLKCFGRSLGDAFYKNIMK